MSVVAHSHTNEKIPNPFSHGVGHIGHALLWKQIAKQNLNYGNFKTIMYSSEIILWIFLLRRCPFKKHHFMYVLLGQS